MNKYAHIKAMESKKRRFGFRNVAPHAGHPLRFFVASKGRKPVEEFERGQASRTPEARTLKEDIARIKFRRKGGGSYGLNELKRQLHAVCGRRK